MILLIDTSTPVCKISFFDGEWRQDDMWRADRELANGLLGYIETNLKKYNKNWNDISGIGIFQGPGSFTGLRIGITVCNTLADSLDIPIVGSSGETWQKSALERLSKAENDRIVLPAYGSDARITKPRK